MSLLGFKLLSSFIILAAAVIAGWIPYSKRIKTDTGYAALALPNGEALANGIFLGAAIIHMLPDASAQFVTAGFQYPIASFIAGIVFLLLVWFEHMGMKWRHQRSTPASLAILAVIMLSLHALLEGTALGVSISLGSAVFIAIAIVSHKWAEGFALAMELNKTILPWPGNIGYFLLFAFMTPLGILIGSSLVVGQSEWNGFTALLNALAAGTFLYLGTLHGFKWMLDEDACCNLRQFTWVIVGFFLMALTAVWG